MNQQSLSAAHQAIVVQAIEQLEAGLKLLRDLSGDPASRQLMPTFLEQYQSELRMAGIDPTWLQGKHVDPNAEPAELLIRFMEAQSIGRLYATDSRGRCWYLDVDGSYANPLGLLAAERSGNIHDLIQRGVRLGVVFDGQNGAESFWHAWRATQLNRR